MCYYINHNSNPLQSTQLQCDSVDKNVNGAGNQLGSSNSLNTKPTLNYLYWLGGFMEGEGSWSISLKLFPATKTKFHPRPEFSVTQHISGLQILYNIQKALNGIGSVKLKSGSTNVYVFYVHNVKDICKYVIPFLDVYVLPFSGRSAELLIFKQVSLACLNKDHLDNTKLLTLVDLVFSIESKKGAPRKYAYTTVVDVIKGKLNVADLKK